MRSDDAATLASGAPEPDLNVDCFDCVPEFQELRDAIDGDDWARFDSAVRSLPTDEATRALFLLGEHEDERFRAFPLAHRDEPIAKVAIAYRELERSWQLRSTTPPTHRGPRLFADVRRSACRAEALLVEACASDPAYAPAWTARVLSARALGVSLAEAQRRFDRVQSLGGDFWAHMHFHQYVEQGWYGSAEQAREFIDTSLAQAVDGSLSGILVPLFHLDRFDGFDEPRFAKVYLASDEVQDELDAAAESSVWHPSRTSPSATLVYGHQLFLVVYWLSGQKEKAARHRRAMGNRTSSEHWNLISTDEASGRAVWRELGQLAEVAS